jgi:hypothetical protein
MSKQQTDKQKKEKDKEGLKPDPETLHTTDPQEEMKGPVSSFIQSIKETAEENDNVTKEEADKKKNENT